MILRMILQQALRDGSLTLIDHAGRRRVFGGAPFAETGTGPAPDPVTIRISDPTFGRRFLAGPELAVGEAYMDGTLTIEEGTLYDMLALMVANMHRHSRGATFFRLHWFVNWGLRWLHQHNPVGRAHKNVAHHYDLSEALYRLFLDDDMQYSCAYWPPGVTDLEVAQLAKKRHIAAKLRLSPGLRVLDIGCGWGGLALHLAREHGVRVVGVTLSQEQLRVARQRAAEAGLEDLVEFRLQDYRQVPETFDRIVSVGMFEHVGVNHYVEFFRKTRALLNPDGVFLLHTIGRAEAPGGTNAWLRKYIFPGGYTPALSELTEAVEHADWILTDLEVLRLHYAETLRHWRDRFQAQRDHVINDLYDARFYRMWEFYLAGCEAVFRFDRQVVFQAQLARSLGALPVTRDYITDDERAAEDVARRADGDWAPAPMREVG
ncbi:SAM-dependent methyltransferase [Roseospira goensis]|uniref:Cyclopropane-fatty-acyl-phospholipid synthase n=1 Tax=Roseospira goensis TaxID=391922 RepID=A0A7W6RWB2_9PROT|nr:cyclopropane-fatty-acyl-phospholipid synthase family protein [Roseospira goensis]MBB4284362.1 cyclopropane-fatty-acyl-phospholipid synthase [Roseospira goensis]